MILSSRFLVASSLLLSMLASSVFSQKVSDTVIWSEPGLPVADTAAATPAQLAQIFPNARAVPTDQLSAALSESQTRLLILPQGSVVPESAWSAISDFLHRGGNLLVLGGRPFTRAAYHDSTGWHLREYSTRFSRPMLIDQYQTTPGSSGATFTRNAEIPGFSQARDFGTGTAVSRA